MLSQVKTMMFQKISLRMCVRSMVAVARSVTVVVDCE